MFDCTQRAVELGASLATRIIPELKDAASCINFFPQQTKDLDAENVILLFYQFTKELFENKKCLDELLKSFEDVIKPALQDLYDNQCIPEELLD